MGASSYVGRVGGLAVALGVGTAIATGNGVASADTTDSPPPPPSTNSSTTEPSTTDTQPVDPTTTPEASESPESDTTTETKTATTVTPGVVSAQTNTGTSGTTAEEEPAETADPEPTETEEPEPTETEEPNEEPGTPTEEPTAVQTAKPKDTAPTTAAEPSTTLSARTIQSSDPASASVIQEPVNVAVFADARALAAAGPINISPMMAATTPAPAPPPAPDLLTAAVNMVSSVVNWVLNPLAGAAPTTPAQPPLIWGLLAFARREFENFFNALSGRRRAPTTMLGRPADHDEPRPCRGRGRRSVSAFPNAPGEPVDAVRQLGDRQLLTHRQPADWPNTLTRFGSDGTDVGVMWDNGMVDDPATPYQRTPDPDRVRRHVQRPQHAGRDGAPTRSSAAPTPTWPTASTVPNGQWFNGNMFGGAPLGPRTPTTARQIIYPEGLPAGVTLIPTAGISVPTPGTAVRRDAVRELHVGVPVGRRRASGRRTTPRSPTPTDNGENWTVAPQHRPVQPAVERQPELPAVARSSGPATVTSTSTAHPTAGRAPRTCRASPRRTSWT